MLRIALQVGLPGYVGIGQGVRFSNQHVVVTGAGTGIGRAIAFRLASEGARLTVLARDVDRLARTFPGELSLACDITVREEVDVAFSEAAIRNGPIHALVANAGIGGPNAPGRDDRFEEFVATNLVGTYWCARAAQRLLASGPGARNMVVIASILARTGVAGSTGYCASKTGLLGLVRSLAAELAADNIQVNAVCPGWVNTEMAQGVFEAIAADRGETAQDAHDIAMTTVPLARMGEPEDIAGTVAWLLSPDARGVTGQAIDQNGGAFMI